MADSFLNKTGLAYFWSKIKAQIPTKVSALSNDSNYQTLSQVADRIAQDTENFITSSTASSTYMAKSNPTGTGSFSLNRKANTTVGTRSHAEGYNATASGQNSHAEGSGTTASSTNSHAEGLNTIAGGEASHAEGQGTNATGVTSHAGGCYTVANTRSQTVIGEYNAYEEGILPGLKGEFAFIIGNGTEKVRSNAMTVDWDGKIVCAGGLAAAGDISTTSTIEASNIGTLAALNYTVVKTF